MGRIILFNRRYCPGEALTNRVMAYAKGFAELGEEVLLYYLISDKNRQSYSIDIPNVKVVNLWEKDGLLAKRVRGISFIKNYLLFLCKIRRDDSVFFYGLYEFQFLIAMVFRKRAKMYCESTEHPDAFKKHNRRYKNHLKRVLNRLNALFVISQTLKDYYISIGVDKDKIHVINMFVDTNRFANLKKEPTEKYIAYCGAVSYSKDGANILIEAFSVFRASHRDYKLYIIGKGIDNTVINKLRVLAEQLGVNDAVVFTGLVEPHKMPQLLYNARILALARPDNLQAQNGFPTKLGEYLATGNPVVVTGVGEIPYFVKHRVNGFLAEPDPISFSEQLSWVADHYDESLIIGERGRDLVNSAFSYYDQVNKVLTVINGEREDY